jgi:thiosulfate/3-mercaptopyruvate sulfurtransferase
MKPLPPSSNRLKPPWLAEHAMNPPLITASELAQRLAQTETAAHTLVVDCRFNLADTQAGQQAWQQAHIPGALYAHLDQDLSGPQTGSNGRHPLPTPEAFAATLQKWGVTPQTHVVAYDDAGGMFAARLWWMLTHWSGLAHCQVLDGGWPQWLQHHAEAATQVTHRPSTDALKKHRPATQTVVTCADVLAALNQPDTMQLIDARAPDRFQGQNETMDPIGGHIPGAINRFFKDNLTPAGTFKPAPQLQEEWQAIIGTRPTQQIVHQCGSGVTACHNLLAMDAAGLTGSRLYAGSWSEWCADPSRPMVR